MNGNQNRVFISRTMSAKIKTHDSIKILNVKQFCMFLFIFLINERVYLLKGNPLSESINFVKHCMYAYI